MEFALVSPVLLTLLFGIVQFGFFFHAQANMGNAVREAARQLAVGAATIGGTSSCASSSSGTAEAVACGNITGLSLARITVTAIVAALRSPIGGFSVHCPIVRDGFLC